MEPPTEEGGFFNVRWLVALDMGLHGPTFILIKFSLGAPVPVILGFSLILRSSFSSDCTSSHLVSTTCHFSSTR